MTASALTLDERLAIDGGKPTVVDRPDSFFHGPAEIGEEEIAAVTAVLRSRNLFRFSRGADESPVAQFEKQFAQMAGVPHALAVNSGTSALICALVGLGISSGDEVIVPAYTYIATAAAVLARGAFPVIAEIDESLGLDLADVERKITPRTKLIIPVHMRGVPSRMDRIMELARRHGLKVLEDCAQANGGSYRGRPLGSWGDAAAFSFQQFKVMTAGEGGGFVTADKETFDRGACYHDSAYAFWKQRANDLSIPPFLGENYRMCEMSGALALAQLQKRDAILARCRAIKRRFTQAVEGLSGITLQQVPDAEGDCGLALVMFVADATMAKRFSAALRAEGVNAGSIFDDGIPDRHIYYHWDYILQKRSPDRNGYPWTGTEPACQVQYAKDQCPRTIEILSRSVAIYITQRMSDVHVDSCIAAIRKVHRGLWG
jgi:8-amino-3,8-dideoxy-alpha-D-manno-octulosonate transaminase